MVRLFDREMSRRDVARHAGLLSQFAGVRLMTLGDGVERGIRMLEFRTGTGLRFTVLVDRALDIADCDFRGQSIGWNSPAGFRHPGLHEYEGEGGLAWARSFSGLLVTCGLATSKSDARRVIEEGGAYLNNDRITDPERVPDASDLVAGWLVLRRGRSASRVFVRT